MPIGVTHHKMWLVKHQFEYLTRVHVPVHQDFDLILKPLRIIGKSGFKELDYFRKHLFKI